MKSVTKLILGAAVLAGSVNAAHAANTIPLPSTNNSDLLFFVSDTKTNATYTAVLSQTINGASGYFTTADAQTAGATVGTINTINNKANFTTSFAGDTALSSFISGATAAGDTLSYGVIGLAYSGATGTQRAGLGKTLFVGSASDASSPLSISASALAGGGATSFLADIKTLNLQTYDGFNGTTSGVIGTPASAGGLDLSSAYTVGLKTDTSTIGQSYTLYGFTDAGSTGGNSLAFSLGTISFDGTTLSFVGNTVSSVPLPAAAWLLGSGLLGLLGVGRRRDVAAA